jgi:hypothetical protein
MKQKNLKKRLYALPAAAQREVVDLIAALEARHSAAARRRLRPCAT